MDTNQCNLKCPPNKIFDHKNKICLGNALPCPIMQERGQDFHSNQLGGMVLDSANDILLTFSRNENLLKFWNYQNGKIITTLSDHKGTIYGLSLDVAKDSLISYSNTGEIIYWQYSKAQ